MNFNFCTTHKICINSFSLVPLFFKSISFHSCRYGGDPIHFKVVPCGMSLSTLCLNNYHSLLWGRLTGNQSMANNNLLIEQKGWTWFEFQLSSTGSGMTLRRGVYLKNRIRFNRLLWGLKMEINKYHAKHTIDSQLIFLSFYPKWFSDKKLTLTDENK